MELIRQNPYHVIGVLAGASQREISRQQAKIKALQKVGRDVEFDSDLHLTGKPDRSNGAVEKAFADIGLNQNKLYNGLFWFVKHNHLDETALNYLSAGDDEKAEDIWRKVTDGKTPGARNFAAFNNLGTLNIAKAFTNGTVDTERFEEGVRLKTELLTSDRFSDFCELVADETYTVDSDKELKTFTTALLNQVNSLKTGGEKLQAAIGSAHPKLKPIVSEELKQAPMSRVERKTEQISKKRKQAPEEGLELADELFKSTKTDLNTLARLLGKTDAEYRMLSDRLAKELLQCGVDYFGKYQDEEERHNGDLGEDVRNLFKRARATATGEQAKERVDENIQGLQEWIDNAVERRKQKLVGDDLNYIFSQLKTYQQLRSTIENAEELLNKCRRGLRNMREELGVRDELYLNTSSAVVQVTMGIMVTVVNREQNDINIRMGNTLDLERAIRGALDLSRELESFDMIPEMSSRFRENYSTLKSIAGQLGISTRRRSSGSTSSNMYSGSSRESSPPSDSSSSGDDSIPGWLIILGIMFLLFVFANAC